GEFSPRAMRASHRKNSFPLDGGRLGWGWNVNRPSPPHPDPPPQRGEGEYEIAAESELFPGPGAFTSQARVTGRLQRRWLSPRPFKSGVPPLVFPQPHRFRIGLVPRLWAETLAPASVRGLNRARRRHQAARADQVPLASVDRRSLVDRRGRLDRQPG